jgi:hypothetical protein
MARIQVGLATIEWLELDQTWINKPMGRGDFEIEGVCDKFRVTTLDGLNMVFGIIRWPSHKPEVGYITHSSGESKYERLTGAGRLGIFDSTNGNPDEWSFELRAMKYGEGQTRPTLKQVTLAELDRLLEGQSAGEILKVHGAKALGKRGELAPAEAGNRMNELLVTSEPRNNNLIAVAFTLTRVLAIMKDFGK